MQKTIHQILIQSSQELAHNQQLNQVEGVIEARLLLQHVLNVSRAWLISHEKDSLSGGQQAALDALIQRRLNGEPIAYILGFREFYGLLLKTTPATLIPRPDTETLVEAALAKIPQDENFNILDLGTGTGAVALAIASQRPQANVTGVDASKAALEVAIENTQSLNIKNVRLIQSDWFAELPNEKFDVIVSNPPYIAENNEHLTQGDLRFEPITALASGQDGLDDIRKIIQAAPQYLNSKGWLMLEHGYDQAEKVAELLKQQGFNQVSHAPDLSGTLRVILGAMP